MPEAADPIRTCHGCHFYDFRPEEFRALCAATPRRLNIVDQAQEGCPRGYFENPLPATAMGPSLPPELSLPGASEADLIFRSIWRTIHLRPASLAEDFDRAAEKRWIEELPLRFPAQCKCAVTEKTERWAKFGAARAWWFWAVEKYPPDLRSLRAYHEWGVFIHNLKNEELGRKPIDPIFAARIHGWADRIYSQKEIERDIQSSGPVRAWVNADWGLGDAIALTAALRDAHAAFPGEFEFYLKTCFPDVFANLSGVHAGLPAGGAPEIRLRIGGRHPEAAGHGEHLIGFFRRRLGRIIRREIPAGENRPWLARPDPGPAPVEGKYWILAAGWRSDISSKSWEPSRWQRIIDELSARGKLVLIGATPTKDLAICDLQPQLRGNVVNLVGKTTHAEMIRLIAHPDCIGTIGLESSHAHIARAFDKKTVVLAGSRIRSGTVRYGVPQEAWLGDESFPCTGCDRHRVKANSPDDRDVCMMPSANGHASCMNRITPRQVIEAVLNADAERRRHGATETRSGAAETNTSPPPSLRVGLCSFYTPNIESWARPAAQRMADYCRRNGYRYAPFDPNVLPAPHRHVYYQKPEMIAEHLSEVDLMTWVDADCVIVRPDFRIESVLDYGEADLYLTIDVNGMNAGVMVWRNTNAAFELMLRWKKAGERATGRNSDQDQLGRLIRQMGAALKVIYLPKPLINAYDDEAPGLPAHEEPGWLVHCVDDRNKDARMRKALSRLPDSPRGTARLAPLAPQSFCAFPGSDRKESRNHAIK